MAGFGVNVVTSFLYTVVVGVLYTARDEDRDPLAPAAGDVANVVVVSVVRYASSDRSDTKLPTLRVGVSFLFS